MAKKSILKNKPGNLIKKYYRVLTDKGYCVEKIILFGSYARGKQKYWSDLDLCVVSKEFGQNDFDETVALKKATTEVDSMIEPHPYSPQGLRDKWDPLAVEINKHGINWQI